MYFKRDIRTHVTYLNPFVILQRDQAELTSLHLIYLCMYEFMNNKKHKIQDYDKICIYKGFITTQSEFSEKCRDTFLMIK